MLLLLFVVFLAWCGFLGLGNDGFDLYRDLYATVRAFGRA